MNTPDSALPPPVDLSHMIEAAASAHGLPPRLVAAIVRVESGGNAWATRYEPGFYERYIRDQKTKAFGAVSVPTEKNARATSWGLMQVMGETARCLGCTLPFLSALCDPATGLDWGCNLLKRLRARYLDTYGWAGVVSAYNAGSVRTSGGKLSNQPYVDKVLAACGGAWPNKE